MSDGLRSITIYLGDAPAKPPADPKKELQGKKIFASNYCPVHNMGVLLVRPVGEGIDAECAINLLRDLAVTIADRANEQSIGGVN